MLFLILLLALAVLNCGWIIWPQIGVYAGAVQGAVFFSVLLAAVVVRLFRR
jgi:hypothetical protein